MAIRKASGSTAINRGVAAAVSTIANPTAGVNPIVINFVYVTDSSYNILDDTAVSSAGGYLKIIGTGFESGCVAYIGGTAASSTTFVSGTEIRVQTPVLSSNTYMVYVLNPDNTIGIKLNAVVVSGTPSWVTSATLDNLLVDTSISIQFNASSDTSISYTLAAGSSLPSGTTLYSNGLFTGTVTGLTTDTVYNFGVVATDNELQDTSRTFTVTIGLGDPFFNTTVSLVNGDANTWITDSGATKRVLTLGGNVFPSPFSPYNTNWSAYHDGTGDYISVANTTPAAFGSGPYTIEFWYWGDGSSLNYQPVFIGSGGLSTFVGYESGVSIWTAQSGGPLIRVNGILLKNAWNFIQFIRTSTAANGLSMTVNGTTWYGQDPYTWGDQTFTVAFDSTPRYVTGYLADFRISKTARSISTPTSKFIADANTTFLTFQDGYTIDRSPAASPIVKNGDLAYRSFGPYTETDTTTGSVYFDGTGDFLTVPDSASLELGDGNFCVELWFYPTSTASTRVLLSKNSGSYGPMLIWTSSASLQAYSSNNGTTWSILNPAAVGTIQTNNWYHVAVYKLGTVIYTALNGVVAVANASATTTPIDNASNWTFGTQPDGTTNPFIGYISDARITVGSSPYTSSHFNPPTAPLTATANTQLLALQYRRGENNHRIHDESGIKPIITRNGNVSMGSFTPYSPAGWSGFFDGTGDYLTVADNDAWDFSNGNFTIEGWFYTSASSGAGCIVGQISSTAQAITSSFGLYGYYNGYPYFLCSLTGVGVYSTLTSSVATPLSSWNHLAVVRNGTTITMYLNGVSVGTLSVGTTAIIPVSASLGIGRAGDYAGDYYAGYVSNLRIVKGVAVYTGNFTVPITSLTATQSSGTNISAISSGTGLLTLQDNRFKDNSSNAFAVTKFADARIQAFSPFRPSAQYSPALHGGSAYFDGTGDYLSYNSSAAELTIGTVDFIIECWVYGMASGSAWWCFDCRPGADGVYPLLYWDGTSFVFYVSTAARITSSAINIYGQWAHVVVSRVSGSTRMFVNGVVQSTVYSDTNSYLSPGASRPYVGLNGLNGLGPSTGYISGLRVLKNVGVTSVTVPTSPPPNTGNTMLYTSFTGAGVIDASARSVYETVGDAKISNIQTKFGSGSMFFDGTGDYISSGNSHTALYNLTATDFTVEAWIYPTSTISSTRQIVGNWDSTLSWALNVSATDRLGFEATGTGAYSNPLLTMTSNTTVTINAWNHVAIRRSGNTFNLYLNGSVANTQTNGITIYSSTNGIKIGSNINAQAFVGYIDDVRVTKNARTITASPTQAFFTK